VLGTDHYPLDEQLCMFFLVGFEVYPLIVEVAACPLLVGV